MGCKEVGPIWLAVPDRIAKSGLDGFKIGLAGCRYRTSVQELRDDIATIWAGAEGFVVVGLKRVLLRFPVTWIVGDQQVLDQRLDSRREACWATLGLARVVIWVELL